MVNKITKLHVSEVEKISEAKLITRNKTGDVRPIEEKIDLIHFKEKIPEGSVGTKLSLIALGKADAHINTNKNVSKWDTLGSQVILEEAGGIITDLYGNKLDYSQEGNNWLDSFVASNGKIHPQLLENIRRFYPL